MNIHLPMWVPMVGKSTAKGIWRLSRLVEETYSLENPLQIQTWYLTLGFISFLLQAMSYVPHPVTKLMISKGDEWKEAEFELDNPTVKFNHYAFISQEDARRKSEMNRNPFMNFSE